MLRALPGEEEDHAGLLWGAPGARARAALTPAGSGEQHENSRFLRDAGEWRYLAAVGPPAVDMVQ